MKNALVKWSVGVAILLGGTLFFTGKQVFAHGYVESPLRLKNMAMSFQTHNHWKLKKAFQKQDQ